MAGNKTKTATWVKIVLAISLALNLGIAGIIVGLAFRGAHPPMPKFERERLSMPVLLMPDEYRERFHTSIRERRSELREERGKLRQLRQKLISALQMEPFDISLVEAVLEEQRGLLTGLVKSGHDEVIRQIASMSEEDRAYYLENLLQNPRNEYIPPSRERP